MKIEGVCHPVISECPFKQNRNGVIYRKYNPLAHLNDNNMLNVQMPVFTKRGNKKSSYNSSASRLKTDKILWYTYIITWYTFMYRDADYIRHSRLAHRSQITAPRSGEVYSQHYELVSAVVCFNSPCNQCYVSSYYALVSNNGIRLLYQGVSWLKYIVISDTI